MGEAKIGQGQVEMDMKRGSVTELESLVAAYTHTHRNSPSYQPGRGWRNLWLRQGDLGRRGCGRCLGPRDCDPSDSLGTFAM